MKLEEAKKAWNNHADQYNQWDSLDGNERAEWTLKYIADQSRQALDDLSVAVYAPEKSSLSVAHAMSHIKQILSMSNKENS